MFKKILFFVILLTSIVLAGSPIQFSVTVAETTWADTACTGFFILAPDTSIYDSLVFWEIINGQKVSLATIPLVNPKSEQRFFWANPPLGQHTIFWAVFAYSGLEGCENSASFESKGRPGKSHIKLGQNFPNPFNGNTQIPFGLERDTYANLSIYNILGQRIRVLVDGQEKAGAKIVSWDGKNGESQFVASGSYIYSLWTPDWRESKKMKLLR